MLKKFQRRGERGVFGYEIAMQLARQLHMH